MSYNEQQLPEGRYRGSVKSAALVDINGKDAVEITFDVFAFESGGGEQGVAGEEARVNLFLTEKAEKYTLDKLEAIGFNGDFEAPSFLQEKASRVPLDMRYNDRGYPQWDLAREGAKRASTATARKYAAKWGQRFAANKRAAESQPSPPASARDEVEVATDQTVDDLPF